MRTQQMELELTASNKCPRVIQRERRATRASWWFHQMHQLVDGAVEWEPSPRFQMEEQIWLTQMPKAKSSN